jgi:hypothetical protein
MKFIPMTDIITSRAQLKAIIEQFQEDRGIYNSTSNGTVVYEMYRGQGKNTWKLEPNISRNIKDIDQLRQIEKDMINEFHNELVNSGRSQRIQGGFLNGDYHGDWLLIQQAQHYELPTRFMDWTIRWDIALYFAVSNKDNDAFDGDLWMYILNGGQLLVDNNESTYRGIDPYVYDESKFLNSASFASSNYLTELAIHRKNVQQGRFFIQSYSNSLIAVQDNPDHKRNLTRFSIPSSAKASIRNELEALGITKEALYIEDDPFIIDLNSRLKSKYGI